MHCYFRERSFSPKKTCKDTTIEKAYKQSHGPRLHSFLLTESNLLYNELYYIIAINFLEGIKQILYIQLWLFHLKPFKHHRSRTRSLFYFFERVKSITDIMRDVQSVG